MSDGQGQASGSVRRGAVQGALGVLGLDLHAVQSNVTGSPRFARELREWKRRAAEEPDFPLGRLFPMLGDRTDAAGVMSGHYFHQDLLVARRVHEARPRRHVDVGSRVDGLIAHLAVFREVDVIDIRPLRSEVENVSFVQADLMSLPAELERCTDSLSCLHALEHFGLGRYGDPIDPGGYRSGLDSLTRMLEPGGILYLSVPIGPQRVEFNAHRVFSVPYLTALVSDRFEVQRFSYVDDVGDLHADVDVAAGGDNFGCIYGCGIWELRRIDDAR